MKTTIIYSMLLLVGILSACNKEEILASEAPQSGSGAILLTVSAGDFVTDGAPHTRATESPDGSTIAFEAGDRIGLIALKNNGTVLVANNVPYTYDGANWAFDSSVASSEGTGKTALYYDGIATYIAYFPYSKDADDVTTLDDLKGKFTPKTDQRSAADYCASDLLVWTSGAASVPQKTLNITLTHAYASLFLSPKVECTLADGSNTKVTLSSSLSSSFLSHINLTVGSDICFPFQAADGSFRYILPAGTSGPVRWFYTFGDKRFGGSKDFSGGAATANTRYVQEETLKEGGEYTLSMAHMGDFYCKNGSGNAYLIPGEISSLSDAQKAACLGIVLKAGKDGSGNWKDDCTYQLKNGATPMTAVHGYVLALHDANGGNTCTWGSAGTQVTHNDMDRNQYTGFYGYKNTQAIKTFNNNGSTLQANFPAVYYAGNDYETRDNNKYAAPANSSGWFFPSAGQCWYWYNNRDLLLTQVKKATENATYSWQSYYWCSSEDGSDPSNLACCLGFSGSVYNFNKGSLYYVRSCLAF